MISLLRRRHPQVGAPTDMIRRLFGWWFFAEAVAARLTTPPADIEACDADVHRAISGSRLFSFAQTVAVKTERAWHDSRVRRVVDLVEGAWPSGPLGDRIRLVAWCAAVAALIVLLLQTLESAKDGPLRWIPPLAVGVVGAVAACVADPLARAWEDKRRR